MTEVTQVTDFKGLPPSTNTQNDNEKDKHDVCIIHNIESDSGEKSDHFFGTKKTSSNENSTQLSSENTENQIEKDYHVSQGDSQIKDKTGEKYRPC